MDVQNPTDVTLTGFIHGFLASLSVIIVSEIGDKTFFIAAIMAMKHSRLTVFLGAISALVLMTILSGQFLFLLANFLGENANTAVLTNDY